jgi:tRNA A37 methylthiotransferase MiaB
MILKNPRHEKFCQLVASGMKPADAYVSLGYSANGAAPSANNLLKRADVAERVRELKELAAQSAVARLELKREWVLEQLVDNVRKCKQDVAVLDRNGQPTGVYTFQAAAANRALELIGKELGMFVDRSHTKPTRIEDLTDEMLDAMIAAAKAEDDEHEQPDETVQ